MEVQDSYFRLAVKVVTVINSDIYRTVLPVSHITRTTVPYRYSEIRCHVFCISEAMWAGLGEATWARLGKGK